MGKADIFIAVSFFPLYFFKKALYSDIHKQRFHGNS